MAFKDKRATIEIDLNKNIEELWNNLDKDARWGVNKAKKFNLNIEVENPDSAKWGEFYNIYKETIIRGGITPKPSEDLQKETSKLFICIKDGKTIAGAAIKLKEKIVELFLNASIQGYLKFQPNNLLYWNIIEWAKSNSYEIFDLGGYQLNAKSGDKLYEVNRFKERWGGKVKEYEVKSNNPFYILGRKIIRNFSSIKKIRDWLKLKIYRLKESYKINSPGKRGLWKFIRNVFKKLIFDRNKIIIYSLNLEEINILKPKVKCKFSEIEDISKFKKKGLEKESVKDRILNGDKLFGMIEGRGVLHYSWLKFDEMNITEVNHKIKLGKGEACIYDCWTDECFRGRGLYPSMLGHLKKYLKERGFTKVYIYAGADNLTSINGIEKAGFIKEIVIEYLKLFIFENKKIKSLKNEEA